MSATVTGSHGTPGDGLGQFAQQVMRGHPPAVAKAALMLKAEIVHQLSQPGRGRVYARARQYGGRSGGPETARALQTRQSFNRRLRGVAASLNTGALAMRDVGKAFVRSLHRASRPGDPPAPDTGALKNSAFVQQVDGGYLVGVAGAYARPLEFGGLTGRTRTIVLAPRPFMRPALAAVGKRLGLVFRATVKSSTIRAPGGR